ncbi:hypothetical protein Y695_04356 [Hydrogenophaga sp. T4]|nr:hypothetical protein Y695_04356 [Hydrogenophaga sp. T4]
MRQVVHLHTRPAVRAHPGPVGDVGDGVIARQEFVVLQLAVEHAEQAFAFALITVDDGRDLLGKVAEEHIGLAHHRPDAAHLEHQPLQHARAALGVRGHEAAGLFGQVDQAGARFEHRKIVGLVVDDGRDAAVGVDGQESGRLLLPGRQVQHLQRVGQAQLFERDGHFVTIGRGGGVQIKHSHPPAPLRAFPPKGGPHLWPGKAGSTVCTGRMPAAAWLAS